MHTLEQAQKLQEMVSQLNIEIQNKQRELNKTISDIEKLKSSYINNIETSKNDIAKLQNILNQNTIENNALIKDIKNRNLALLDIDSTILEKQKLEKHLTESVNNLNKEKSELDSKLFNLTNRYNHLVKCLKTTEDNISIQTKNLQEKTKAVEFCIEKYNEIANDYNELVKSKNELANSLALAQNSYDKLIEDKDRIEGAINKAKQSHNKTVTIIVEVQVLSMLIIASSIMSYIYNTGNMILITKSITGCCIIILCYTLFKLHKLKE